MSFRVCLSVYISLYALYVSLCVSLCMSLCMPLCVCGWQGADYLPFSEIPSLRNMVLTGEDDEDMSPT